MRRSDAHEYRQAYNAQAVVCAEGAQLILPTNLVATTADAPSFAATILAMQATIGLPRTVLADTGYASGQAVTRLQARGIEPLVAIGRTQMQRPYDVRSARPTASQATGSDLNHHAAALPRQVRQLRRVGAVQPGGGLAAAWAGWCWRAGTANDGDMVRRW